MMAQRSGVCTFSFHGKVLAQLSFTFLSRASTFCFESVPGNLERCLLGNPAIFVSQERSLAWLQRSKCGIGPIVEPSKMSKRGINAGK